MKTIRFLLKGLVAVAALLILIAIFTTTVAELKASALTSDDYGINGEMVVTPVVLQQNVWSEDQMYEIDVYHESDDILMRDDNYVFYLNQTSPIRDTIYIYHCVNINDWTDE